MVSQIDGVWYCKSLDTKPTKIARNGQTLIEIDTGKVYIFDAEGDAGSEWVEFGGGS